MDREVNYLIPQSQMDRDDTLVHDLEPPDLQISL